MGTRIEGSNEPATTPNPNALPTEAEPIITLEPDVPEIDEETAQIEAAVAQDTQRAEVEQQQNAALKEDEAINQAVAVQASVQETNYRSKMMKAEEENPDDQAEILALSKEFGVAPSFIQGHIEDFRKDKKDKELKELSNSNPNLVRWMGTKDRVSIAQDDVDGLKEVDTIVGKIKFKAPEEGKASFVARSLNINKKQLYRSVLFAQLMHAKGSESQEEIVDKILENQKELTELTDKDDRKFKEAQKSFQKEGEETNQAWRNLVSSFEEFETDNLLDGLIRIGEETGDLAVESVDLLSSMATNIKAQGSLALRSSLNTVAPLVAGIGTGLAGAQAAATTTALATSFTGMGAIVAGGLAGGLGFAAGSFTGSALVGGLLEYTSTLEEALSDQKADTTTREGLLALINDPKIVAQAQDESIRKGFATGAIEGLTTFLIGKTFLKATKGGIKGAKAVAKETGKVLAIEATGEGVGQAGSAAIQKLDIKELDIAGGAQEALAAILTLGAGGAFAYTASGTVPGLRRSVGKLKEKVRQTSEGYHKAQEAKEFMGDLLELGEAGEQTKLKERSPELYNEMVNTTSEGSQVYMQADEWNDHWEKQGENPVEKADELLPGGRADLDKAKTLNHPIQIPLADVADKFTTEESFKDLASKLKRNPEAMSGAQADTMTANIPSLMKGLVQEAQDIKTKRDAVEVQEKEVQANLKEQFKSAGLSSKEAQHSAQLATANVLSNAEILNMSPQEFTELRELQIKGEKQLSEEGFFGKVKEGAKRLLQKEDGKPRGFTQINKSEEIVIGILRDANKSTPLHELGHAFFENMKTVNNMLGKAGEVTGAQLRFKEDVATVLEHFQIESLDQVETKHHENFARSFETYLQEGVAPSEKLKKAFVAFRTWLVNIYKNALGIERAGGQKVNLSEDMRQVFDRMLATEEEINEASANAGYSSEEIESFTDIPQVKESKDLEKLRLAHEDAREEAYQQLMDKQLQQLKKEKTKEYTKRKKELTEEFTKAADESPLYKAVDSIKANEIDGNPTGLETMKMTTEQVKDLLTEEEMVSFPRSLFRAQGADPDIVASYLGFENGKQLVQAISDNPSKEKFISQATELQMDVEFPNFMSPIHQEALEAEASKAVQNDKRGKALKLEMDILIETSPSAVKTLIKKISKRLPTNKNIKLQAERRLANTELQDAKSSTFRAMETKSRREAGVLAAKGDHEGAFNMKLKELLNYQLGRAAVEVESKVNKMIAKNKKRFGKSDKDLKKVGNPDILKAAQSILASFGMVTDVQSQRVETYLSQLEKVDPSSYAKVKGLTEALVNVPTKPYQEMTVEEFNEVSEVVDSLYHIGVEDNFITVDGKKVRKDVIIPQLSATMLGVPKKTVVSDKEAYSSFRMFGNSLKANMTRLEHWVDGIDKKDLLGPWRTFLWNRASEGQTAYDMKFAERFRALADTTKEKMGDVFKDQRKIDLTKYFKGIDPKLSTLNRSEVVMAMVHSGNESNKRKLLLGRGWATVDIDGNLVTDQYDAFMADMFKEGVITEKNMQGIQEIWDSFEAYKPEMQKTHKEMYGSFFKEIAPTPVQTPWGEFAGGYAPATTDKLLVPAQAIRENEASTETSRNQFARAHTPTGMTKSRVDEYNRALSLDYDILARSVEESTRFTVLEPVVNDLNKIVHNPKIIEAIHPVNSDWNGMLSHWLARLATQTTSTTSDTKGGRQFDRFLTIFRQSSSAQLMFLNVKNAILNLTDIPAITTKVDGRKFMKNLLFYMQHSTETMAQIEELSPGTQEMLKSNIHEIRSTYKSIKNEGGFKGNFKALQDLAAKHTYILQQAIDNLLRISAWKAGFDEAISEGHDQKTAARNGERALALTMGRNRPTDISKIESGGALQKSLMVFYSYFNNRANLLMHAQKEDLPTTYLLAIAAPAILENLLARAFRGEWGDDDDDGKLAIAADAVFGSQARYLSGLVPGLGNAARFAEGLINDKPYDDKISLSPMVGMVESMKGGINLLKKDEISGRDVADSMTAMGTIFRLPLGGLRKQARFLIDVEQGKQSADDPVDFVKGLITGKSGE